MKSPAPTVCVLYFYGGGNHFIIGKLVMPNSDHLPDQSGE